MRRRNGWAWLVFAGAAAQVLACSQEPGEASLPNLVVVTLDTTRADHLGLYGYFRNTSPRLDAFAADAVVFDRALAPMATTLPTHLSLFTGTHPLVHGVLANGMGNGRRYVPSPRLRNLAVHGLEVGYDTAAFVSAMALSEGTGIERGFEHFDQPAGLSRRYANHTTDAALHWLESAEAPFLLWVHFYDAHWPYAPPPPHDQAFVTDDALEAWMLSRRLGSHVAVRGGSDREDVREMLNLYDGELRFQDEQLGRLLDALSAREDWPRTAVLIAGDHGEGLSQHGDPDHGATWDEQLRVPLLMRVPGQPSRRIRNPVSLVDALPTLLALLPVPELEPLLEQARGKPVLDFGPVMPVLSQDNGRHRELPGYRYALTAPHWKYIRMQVSDRPPLEMLFDLRKDPFELRNVADSHARQAVQMRRLLEQAIAEYSQRGEVEPPGEAPLDPEVEAQLRELGYIDTGHGTTTPQHPLEP